MLYINFKFIIVYNILIKRKKNLLLFLFIYLYSCKNNWICCEKKKKELMIISLLFCLYLEFGINKCCFEESLLKVVVYRINRW